MTEAGMPILECIKAATVNAADLLGVSNILGTIEKGNLLILLLLMGIF
jgi:imidazolonepropionase-like amidohydrolase